MSYLYLPSFNVADSTRGTISLWFRVSSDSLQKALSHGGSYPFVAQTFEILKGTIPLITFGQKIDGELWGSTYRVDCVGPVNPIDGNQAIAGSSHPANPVTSPMEPSHIGITTRIWDYPTLLIVLQTSQRPMAQGLYNERVECHFGPLEGGRAAVLYQTLAEASYVFTSWPDTFYIEPDFEVTPDVWHHVLASWDLSTSVDTVATPHSGPSTGYVPGSNVHGACQFYFSYDGEDKVGQNNMGRAWAYKGPNDVVPANAFIADFNYDTTPPATDNEGNPLVSGNVDVIPQWHWAATPLALDGGHVGVPAGADYVDNVYHVELAELQFFVGLTTGNDRISAFIDKDGGPTPPEETEELLGRRPDILLHGSSNWQQGVNTGVTGVADDGTTIASGNFQPIGRINKFTPEPKLGE